LGQGYVKNAVNAGIKFYVYIIKYMVKYMCIRCGYSTDHKSHLRSHLKNKKVCPDLYDKIDRKDLLEMLDTENKYSMYLLEKYDIVKNTISEQLSKIIDFDIDNVRQNCTRSASKTGENGVKNAGILSKKCQNSVSKPAESIEKDEFIKCSRCLRGFNSRQARWYHEKSCNIIQEEQKVNLDNANINNNNNDQFNVIGNNNILDMSVKNTTNNININKNEQDFYAPNGKLKRVWGDEDLTYITQIDKLHEYCEIGEKSPLNMFQQITKDIYFNKEYSHNHTVKLLNLSSDIVLIRTGLPDKWDIAVKKSTIQDMFKLQVNTLEACDIEFDKNLTKCDKMINNYYNDANPDYNSINRMVNALLSIDYYKSTGKTIQYPKYISK